MVTGDFNNDGKLDLAIAWNYGFTRGHPLSSRPLPDGAIPP